MEELEHRVLPSLSNPMVTMINDTVKIKVCKRNTIRESNPVETRIKDTKSTKLSKKNIFERTMQMFRLFLNLIFQHFMIKL